MVKVDVDPLVTRVKRLASNASSTPVDTSTKDSVMVPQGSIPLIIDVEMIAFVQLRYYDP